MFQIALIAVSPCRYVPGKDKYAPYFFAVSPCRYVPDHLHPKDKYAPYCYGLAYGGGTAVAEKVVAASPHVPFFAFEDVYVGMCLARLGYRVRTFRRFKNFRSQDPCQQVGTGPDAAPTVLNVSPSAMLELWNAQCPDS